MAVMPEREPWQGLLEDGAADERLVHRGREPARPGTRVPLPADLHPKLLRALHAQGFDGLWAHQAEAIEEAWDRPVVVATGTASGKSLCFQLPIAETLLRDPRARALLLDPTKALAQDQARALHALGLPELRPAIYDGDTPRERRAGIRREANVVLTNPDMLHVGLLPNHAAWGDLLANLAVVVVDEAHVYRGVFGAHVANVLRRLRRVASWYGSAPRFVLASATVGNPGELARALTGFEDVAVVAEDASASAGREVCVWNPPLVDEATGARASALGEAAELLATLVGQGARTICFMKSRKGVELVHRLASARLPPDLAARLAPYRAGYTPQQRRELERRLASGELLGVVATDALELGIDVGTLDAAICVTFPGTVASLRQMWGRAGRRGRGLAVYVAGEDALDQFFCRHPQELLGRPVERALVDHRTEEVLAQHVLCAAHEAPIGPEDRRWFGEGLREACDALVRTGGLEHRRGRYAPRVAEGYPAGDVALRSSSADTFAIVDAGTGEAIGTVDGARAHAVAHAGAVYLHLGRRYEVRLLDLDRRVALVAPFDGDWYTQPQQTTETTVDRLLERRTACGVRLSFGEVTVHEQVRAYQRKRDRDHEPLELVGLDLPSTSFHTQALWWELEEDAPLAHLDVLLGTLHAAEHAQIAVLPLIAMCDRWDIGGLSTNHHPQTGGPTVFVHDAHPGGIGIARTGYEQFERLVRDAHRLIAGCRCERGCPSCVQSPKCGNLNEPLHKLGAGALLHRLSTR